jgi:hypothetical protein
MKTQRKLQYYLVASYLWCGNLRLLARQERSNARVSLRALPKSGIVHSNRLPLAE